MAADVTLQDLETIIRPCQNAHSMVHSARCIFRSLSVPHEALAYHAPILAERDTREHPHEVQTSPYYFSVVGVSMLPCCRVAVFGLHLAFRCLIQKISIHYVQYVIYP